MVPKLLVLALAFYREPLRFSHLVDPTRSLPEAFGQWLAAANKALTPGALEATAAALNTQLETLRKAFLFFLRQTLLSLRADHYRTLGLSRHSSEASIKRHCNLLVRLFHPDRVPDATERNSILTARINSAYQTLCDPRTRRHYDSRLPPLPHGSQTRDWGMDFFRPSESTPRFNASASTGYPLSLPGHPRRAIIWVFAASALIFFGLLTLKDAATGQSGADFGHRFRSSLPQGWKADSCPDSKPRTRQRPTCHAGDQTRKCNHP